MGLKGIKSNNLSTVYQTNEIWPKVAEYGLLSLVTISFKPRDPSIAGLFNLGCQPASKFHPLPNLNPSVGELPILL